MTASTSFSSAAAVAARTTKADAKRQSRVLIITPNSIISLGSRGRSSGCARNPGQKPNATVGLTLDRAGDLSWPWPAGRFTSTLLLLDVIDVPIACSSLRKLAHSGHVPHGSAWKSSDFRRQVTSPLRSRLALG